MSQLINNRNLNTLKENFSKNSVKSSSKNIKFFKRNFSIDYIKNHSTHYGAPINLSYF